LQRKPFGVAIFPDAVANLKYLNGGVYNAENWV
jgi:hypothetical protein